MFNWNPEKGSHSALVGHHFTFLALCHHLKVGAVFLALSGYLIKTSEYHNVEKQIVTKVVLFLTNKWYQSGITTHFLS